MDKDIKIARAIIQTEDDVTTTEEEEVKKGKGERSSSSTGGGDKGSKTLVGVSIYSVKKYQQLVADLEGLQQQQQPGNVDDGEDMVDTTRDDTLWEDLKAVPKHLEFKPTIVTPPSPTSSSPESEEDDDDTPSEQAHSRNHQRTQKVPQRTQKTASRTAPDAQGGTRDRGRRATKVVSYKETSESDGSGDDDDDEEEAVVISDEESVDDDEGSVSSEVSRCISKINIDVTKQVFST